MDQAILASCPDHNLMLPTLEVDVQGVAEKGAADGSVGVRSISTSEVAVDDVVREHVRRIFATVSRKVARKSAH